MLLALLLAAFVSPPAQMDDTAWIAQVKPGARRYFYDEGKPGCPALIAKCRQRAYVVAGDQLVASGRRDGFTSVRYVDARGRETEGWVESAALRTVTLPPPAPRAWLGVWHAWDNEIEVKPARTPGMFRIEGLALWGAHDRWRIENGGVHIGEIAVTARLSGDRLAFESQWSRDDGEDHLALPYDPADEYGCQVRMRLLGPYLLVADNGGCGGANVTFSGIYRKEF